MGEPAPPGRRGRIQLRGGRVVGDFGGDVGSPPWHLYALVATIEVERHAVQNPDVPGWMEADYREGLAEIKALALRDFGGAADRLRLRAALGVVAAAAGDHALATMLGGLDDAELAEYKEEQVAYSERYRLRH